MVLICLGLTAMAQAPIITDQFAADPTARVFNNKVYLYPSHDILPPASQRQDWFCMEDYHVFSSENLRDWTDHGVILSQEQVPWGNPKGYSMWAPDCVERDGTYYFYFPNAPREGRGFAVGVATASRPEGPFTCEPEPIKGIMGIDPCVLIDSLASDHQAYIYWSGMGIRAARLKPNMKELDGESRLMEGLPEGFKEGPFAFRRGDWYYLTFPWVRREGGTETLAYAMSHSPLGPWDFKGLIMAEHANGCWTNHHSIVEYRGQWYLFYHHNDLSPNDDKRRSPHIARLYFRPDGTIIEVKPATKPRPDYFSPIGKDAPVAQPDNQGFIRRWLLREPIDHPVQTNLIFSFDYLQQHLSTPPSVKDKRACHALESNTYNVRLFRFAEDVQKPTYRVCFWATTTLVCDEDIPNVRLAAGSNGASVWWLNDEQVLTLESDRRMVADDGMSARLTLKKGRNTLRCAVVNGPGLSDFCVRFVNEKGQPVTNYTITTK